MPTHRKATPLKRRLKPSLLPMSDLKPILLMLSDPSVSWLHKGSLLRDLLMNLGPESEPLVKSICDGVGKQFAQSVYEDKVQKVDALLKEVQEGPMRGASFVERLPLNGSPVPAALVLLDDGTEAFTLVPKDEILPALRCGDRVILDGKGRVLLRPAGTEPLLRVMVEGEDRELVEGAAQRIAEVVREVA